MAWLGRCISVSDTQAMQIRGACFLRAALELAELHPIQDRLLESTHSSNLRIGQTMPPRSYYNEPREGDYLAFARAFFPEEIEDSDQFFKRTGLPYVNSVKHISAYIGVSPSLIRQILHKPAYHYKTFDLEKRDGSFRKISTPKTYLKVIQWWIYDNILSRASSHDCVHGFVRERSYITNAFIHLSSKHVLNVDIEQFFPSINASMVKNLYINLGYDVYGADVLTKLTTLNGHAPTGAPTSPSIGNLVLREFDNFMSDYAVNRGCLYTRYADDITLSSEFWISAEVADEIGRMVESYGFALNRAKTHFMGPGDRREVTGVILSDKLAMSREWRNKARGFMHRVRMNPRNFEKNREIVFGFYGTLRAVDPEMKQKITRIAHEAISALIDNKNR